VIFHQEGKKLCHVKDQKQNESDELLLSGTKAFSL